MSDTSLLATAERLIAKRGREMSIKRHVAATLVEAGKPWRGYSDDDTEETGVACVILPLERTSFADGERYDSGELIKQSDERAYIKGSVDAIDVGDKIVDGSTTYTVMQTRRYRPGATSILWELWVRR